MTYLDVESSLDTLLSGSVNVYHEREIEAATPTHSTGFLVIMDIQNNRIGGSDTFPIVRYTIEAEIRGDPNTESTLRTLRDTMHNKFNNNNINTNSNIKYILRTRSELNIDNGWLELDIEITDYHTAAVTA